MIPLLGAPAMHLMFRRTDSSFGAPDMNHPTEVCVVLDGIRNIGIELQAIVIRL
jgi:hypothetical protein